MLPNAAMSSDRKTVDFIIEQIVGAGVVSARPMFGEYGVYYDGKMVAIVADDQLFLRPTSGGRAFAVEAEGVSPYPGAQESAGGSDGNAVAGGQMSFSTRFAGIGRVTQAQAIR